MPRRPDPELEKRVLKAATKLWHGGGDKTLSMRALAKEARTNTPAIYRRFKDRRGVLQALFLHLQQAGHQILSSSPSLEEACERYIDYAVSQPREYELFYAHKHEFMQSARTSRMSPTDIGPGFAWVAKKLAERLGGSPEDQMQRALEVWALAHGTASLLISKAVPAELALELRAGCLRALGVLLSGTRKRACASSDDSKL